MKPIIIYLIYILVISCISIILYARDKKLAMKHKWRIPEKVLLGSGLIGGAIGSLFAIYAFRHKTKHWYFPFLNILFLIMHVICGVLIFKFVN